MRIPFVCLAQVMLLCLPDFVSASPELRVRSASDYVFRQGLLPRPRSIQQPWNNRSPGREYLVGDQHEFWTWDLGQMPPQDVLVPATCRAVGAHSYIFVADDQWGVHVTQADVDAMLKVLENQTPQGSINPNQGVIPNEIEVFGPVPDALDADPRVIILLMELQNFMGTEFDGYFNLFNQLTDQESMAQYGYHSNECEMITVNSTIRPPTSDMTLSILAHEFAHLILWGGDADEDLWVGESCAEAAMVVNGYLTDIGWLNDYLANPKAQLIHPEDIHYGACLLFGSYLYERFGAAFLGTLVDEDANGEDGLLSSLTSSGQSVSLDELFLDWATANIGDHLGVADLPYNHPLLEVGSPAIIHVVNTYPPTTPVRGSLQNTSVAYASLVRPADDGDLCILPHPDASSSLLLRALMMDGDQIFVFAPEAGELHVPFSSHPDVTTAYLVLMAHGATVNYSLDIPCSTPVEDGGVDAADDDGGLDAGDEAPDAEQDAGGDDDQGDPGIDAGPDGWDADSDAFEDASPDASSDAGPDSGADDRGGEESNGCSCGAGQGALPLPWLFSFLLVLGWSARVRWNPSGRR